MLRLRPQIFLLLTFGLFPFYYFRPKKLRKSISDVCLSNIQKLKKIKKTRSEKLDSINSHVNFCIIAFLCLSRIASTALCFTTCSFANFTEQLTDRLRWKFIRLSKLDLRARETRKTSIDCSFPSSSNHRLLLNR